MSATVLAEDRTTVAGPPGIAPKRSTNQRLRRHFRRRIAAWLALVGTLCTGSVAMVVIHKPGVYFSEVSIIFQQPRSALYPNSYIASTGGLTVTAGLVQRLVNPTQSPIKMSSSKITLANEGIRNGSSIRLPDDGGQWANNFDQSLLDVQAVGPDASGVANAMRTLINEINATLAKLQVGGHVAAANLITTVQSPPDLPIYYQTGSRIRALAATLVLGVGFTVTAQYWARRYARRRS